MSRVISAPIDINANDLICQIAGAGTRENFNESYFDGSEGRFFLAKQKEYYQLVAIIKQKIMPQQQKYIMDLQAYLELQIKLLEVQEVLQELENGLQLLQIQEDQGEIELIMNAVKQQQEINKINKKLINKKF